MSDTRTLFAFIDGKPMGVFEKTGYDTARFRYEDSYSGTPLSLSMPVSETPDEEVAFFYLDNLLSEDEDTRERLARRNNTSSDTFGLLSQLGEDVAGAVVLSPDPNVLERDPVPLIEPTDEDVAYQIARLRREASAVPISGGPVRFSLAGQQPKFSLARLGDRWFWSTAEVPSTHIFKPQSLEHNNAEVAEKAILDLASRIGIRATESEIMSFQGESVYAARRWDRYQGSRLHAEDLLQATGDPWSEKYSVYPDDIRQLMSKHGLEREYLRQMVFNTAVGNTDAHAKNYSLLLAGNSVRLAPLYDSLPMFLWPKYDRKLTPSINGKNFLEDVTRDDWTRFAQKNGYDPDMVHTEVRDIFTQVDDLLIPALKDAGVTSQGLEYAKRHLETLRPTLDTMRKAGTSSLPAHAGSNANAGEIWVRPHTRNGHPVEGHYRERRSH